MTTVARVPQTIVLGDREVCRLGFGAMQLPGPGVWGEPRDPARARAVLRRAVELGMNLIDTSWYYGPLIANRLIAETLYPYPDHLLIATKLGGMRNPDASWGTALRPEELRAGCETDLRTLRLDRIELVHLRWTRGAELPFREALDALVGLQAEGKIRSIGLSNVTLTQLRDALSRTPLVSVENLYNVAAGPRRLAHLRAAVVEDQDDVLALCADRGLAFLPFYSLAIPYAGTLDAPAIAAIAARRRVSEAQVAIAWLLARSPVMLPIPGTCSVAHLEDNWAAQTIALDPDELAAISAARA
jgi:aryl-alcohol dehydrogenase-like predicted oxidoreductase